MSSLVSLSPALGTAAESKPCSANRLLTAGLSLASGAAVASSVWSWRAGVPGIAGSGSACIWGPCSPESAAIAKTASSAAGSGAAVAGSGPRASSASALGSASSAAKSASASVSSWAITSLLSTSAPLLFRMLTRTPLSGATISKVTLSVSRSIRPSPNFTSSPTCLRQCNKEASATDSASTGTLTSTNMAFSRWMRRTGKPWGLPEPGR